MRLKPIRVSDGLWHDFPVCPHCGIEDEAWGEEESVPKQPWDGSEWTVKCADCGGVYFVTMCVSPTFQTHKEVL